MRCEFFALGAEHIFDVMSAVVDQLCAQADIDVELLSAVEAPLAEVIDALHGASASITAATASVEPDRRLRLDIAVDNGGDLTAESLFDDALDLVEAFFELDVTSDRVRLELELG